MKFCAVLFLCIGCISTYVFSASLNIGASSVLTNRYTSADTAVEVSFSDISYTKVVGGVGISWDLSFIYGTKDIEYDRTGYFFSVPIVAKIGGSLHSKESEKHSELFFGVGYSFLATGFYYSHVDANQYTHMDGTLMLQMGYCFGKKSHGSVYYDIGARYYLVNFPENISEPGFSEVFLRFRLPYKSEDMVSEDEQ